MFQLFPFPCVVDLGLLTVEFDTNCVVLKRKDREYPHVTLFYEKRPRRSYWWPHVTYRPRGGKRRHVELARWKVEHGAEVQRRFSALASVRLPAVLRPVTLAELTHSDWHVVVPGPALVAEIVECTLKGPGMFSARKLADLIHDPERGASLLERLFEHSVSPLELNKPGHFAAYQLQADGFGEEAFLYGYERGAAHLSWFLAPQNVMGMESRELLEHLAPELFPILRRIADVLELPLVTSF